MPRRSPSRGARVELRKIKRAQQSIPDVQGTIRLTVPDHIAALAEQVEETHDEASTRQPKGPKHEAP